MKLLYAVAVVLVVASCEKAPIERQRSDNPDMQVDLLFTQQGCSVYRFYDVGEHHYFADCRGSVSSRIPQGKASRPEDIPTIGNER